MDSIWQLKIFSIYVVVKVSCNFMIETFFFQFIIFRYSRLTKNQLRVYEKFADGDIDHKATIKEYSRSSADQDIPHLHELRPSNVLQMAMNHLLCNAIGKLSF